MYLCIDDKNCVSITKGDVYGYRSYDAGYNSNKANPNIKIVTHDGLRVRVSKKRFVEVDLTGMKIYNGKHNYTVQKSASTSYIRLCNNTTGFVRSAYPHEYNIKFPIKYAL